MAREAQVDGKILLVDDDPNVLAGYVRQLRKRFDLTTAQGAEAALELLAAGPPFVVVVSDLRMPRMDGIEFLGRVRERSPDTIRVMLTGYADLTSAIAAVNQGSVFRFLTKPCETADLTKALVDGIRQYRLVTAERELLEKTLGGAVKLLTDLMALLKPDLAGRNSRIANLAKRLAVILAPGEIANIGLAALLSQIGLLALPDPLVRRICRGRPLPSEQASLGAGHPRVAAELLANIPRLETVAQLVALQQKRYDGGGPPEDAPGGEGLPMGARILKVAVEFDALTSDGAPRGEALARLRQRPGCYDPRVLIALGQLLGDESRFAVRFLRVAELKPGMILAQDVQSLAHQRKLLAQGQELSEPLIGQLLRVAGVVGVREPLRVFDPLLIR